MYSRGCITYKKLLRTLKSFLFVKISFIIALWPSFLKKVIPTRDIRLSDQYVWTPVDQTPSHRHLLLNLLVVAPSDFLFQPILYSRRVIPLFRTLGPKPELNQVYIPLLIGFHSSNSQILDKKVSFGIIFHFFTLLFIQISQRVLRRPNENTLGRSFFYISK